MKFNEKCKANHPERPAHVGRVSEINTTRATQMLARREESVEFDAGYTLPNQAIGLAGLSCQRACVYIVGRAESGIDTRRHPGA